MKAVVAMVVAVLLTGCFPNNKKHRTYAKIGEGAALASGVALLYAAGTGADCDEMRAPGESASGCRSNASLYSGVGLGLILTGLVGFIATVSTSPEDKPDQPANTRTPVPITTNAATDSPASASSH